MKAFSATLDWKTSLATLGLSTEVKVESERVATLEKTITELCAKPELESVVALVNLSKAVRDESRIQAGIKRCIDNMPQEKILIAKDEKNLVQLKQLFDDNEAKNVNAKFAFDYLNHKIKAQKEKGFSRDANTFFWKECRYLQLLQQQSDVKKADSKALATAKEEYDASRYDLARHKDQKTLKIAVVTPVPQVVVIPPEEETETATGNRNRNKKKNSY